MLAGLFSFSFRRFFAVLLKEFIQMRRDRLTFAMMVGIPVIQLTLFGFAINTDPKHLPMAVLSEDFSPFSRSFIAALRNSDYFRVVENVESEARALELLKEGKVQFVLTIPVDFGRSILRGECPAVLVEADATDPSAVSNGISTLGSLLDSALSRELSGGPSFLEGSPSPAQIIVHSKYNPERNTQYNIVPGLMGVILTMTMVFITALAITREKERGTMENLLSTPLRPLEVMTGKIVPYIFVGYIQITLVLLAARYIFYVPMLGNLPLLLFLSFFFIAANLTVGVTISTIARNQLQAVQMSIFFFLPSLLLSGFMFPFRGMPNWAQNLGNILPLTHYLPIVRGILLKGNGFIEVMPHFWAITAFLVVALFLGVIRYRQTLD
ncbi:MAG: mannose-1-phosphate guanyltransferase [Lentisphaerae bacterium GWF2_52_8]|nr:MAG: mannose-1-phosphate guanyltransferase [Lentisphaerae bacterium GWF2_52_8]